MPALATVADLEVRLGVDVGSLAGADLARAEAALADVSAVVREEAGKTWVDDDDVTITAPASALAVVYAASLRIYRNPDGFVSENLGGSYSYSYGDSEAILTDTERALIRKAATASTGGVLSVVTPSAYSEPTTDVESVWWE
jgi:hypothetical protein